MNLQKFREDYERSGMTQKAYGVTIGVSASMVSYYLRKSRQEDEKEESEISRGFSQIQKLPPPKQKSFADLVKRSKEIVP